MGTTLHGQNVALRVAQLNHPRQTVTNLHVPEANDFQCHFIISHESKSTSHVFACVFACPIHPRSWGGKFK